MVTLEEYRDAPENAIFTHKENKFGQPKSTFRFKLDQAFFQIRQIQIQRGDTPEDSECLKEVGEIIAATLEHFDIDMPKILDDRPPKKHKSKDGKGQFCHRCGLQKENCKIVEEGEKVIRVCAECIGI